MRNEIKICSICEEEFTGWGNNAEPVNDGECCKECNWKIVIPTRLNNRKTYETQQKEN